MKIYGLITLTVLVILMDSINGEDGCIFEISVNAGIE